MRYEYKNLSEMEEVSAGHPSERRPAVPAATWVAVALAVLFLSRLFGWRLRA